METKKRKRKKKYNLNTICQLALIVVTDETVPACGIFAVKRTWHVVMTAWGTSNLVYIPNFVWMHAIATELSAKTRIKNGLNLLPVWILVRGLLWLAAVYIPAKFQVSISIGGLFIALCVQFKMAGAAILFFVESKPWRCGCVPEDILSRCVKCCTNMVNSGWFMVVNWFVFLNSGRHQLGFHFYAKIDCYRIPPFRSSTLTKFCVQGFYSRISFFIVSCRKIGWKWGSCAGRRGHVVHFHVLSFGAYFSCSSFSVNTLKTTSGSHRVAFDARNQSTTTSSSQRSANPALLLHN